MMQDFSIVQSRLKTSFQKTMERPDIVSVKQTQEAKKELAQLKRVTKDIEAVFLKHLVSEMRKGINEGMFGANFQARFYSDYMDDAIAQQISRGKGIGIAEMLYTKLEPIVINQIIAKQKLSDQSQLTNDNAKSKDLNEETKP
jgi:flagellar protein FlgJ